MVTLQAHLSEGALAEFEQSSVIINKGTGCIARGADVRLRMVDTVGVPLSSDAPSVLHLSEVLLCL